MIWAFFAANATCNCWVDHATPLHTKVFQSKFAMISVWQLQLGWKLVVQQDNGPKHSSKSTTECPKERRVEVCQWSSYSPDLSLTEMLERNIKTAVHKRMAAKREWTRILPQWCERLMPSYKRRLLKVMQPKMVLRADESWGVVSFSLSIWTCCLAFTHNLMCHVLLSSEVLLT